MRLLPLNAQIVLLAWLAFLVYWLASAGAVKPTVERQSRGSWLTHRLPLWLAGILLLANTPRWGLNLPWYTAGWGSRWFGVWIVLLGLGVAIWARRTIGANWSGTVTLKQGHELVQNGPYRFVRNPIYTGILLMFLGTAIQMDFRRALAAFVLAVAGISIKIRQEEGFMLRQFPDAFPAYRRRVRSLVPFLF